MVNYNQPERGDLVYLPAGAKDWWGIKNRAALIIEVQYYSPDHYRFFILADGIIHKMENTFKHSARILERLL